MTAERKQADYLMRARRSACLKDFTRCKYWIKKAQEYRPLSDIQWHNIRMVTKDSFMENIRAEVKGGKQS